MTAPNNKRVNVIFRKREKTERKDRKEKEMHKNELTSQMGEKKIKKVLI